MTLIYAPKKCFLLVALLLLASCQQELPASTDNLQKIFDTRDFTVTFIVGEKEHFMGFRQDYMTYKHNGNTIRETISYEQALAVNNFIQQQLVQYDNKAVPNATIVESPQYKVVIKTAGDNDNFQQLLTKLEL
ncbi:MAG: hypothetical protein WBA16_05475 [Nonlabens sp.]